MPKNDKTRKNSSKLRGPYREFDPASQAMREVLIRGYAKRYIEHVAANNGKCMYGFVVGLARESASVTDRLRINRKDIINEATRIMAKRREVSPGTLQASPATEAVDTPGGNETQVAVGLNLLARAAAEPRPLPPVAAASIEPTIPNDNPNKCSHHNCFTPFEPSTCCTMGCDGTVHQYCFHLYQSNGSIVLPSLDELLCRQCCTNPESQADPPTPNATTTNTMESLVTDNNATGRGTSLHSAVHTHPDSTGALFECAAGAMCTARHPYNTFGTHISCCCKKKIHSHVTCGMTLAEYISKNPSHVGYTFTSGQVIVADEDENEQRIICHTCIKFFASAKSPTPIEPTLNNNVDGRANISNPITIPTRKKVGRPKGSTKAKKLAKAMDEKKAINWVVMEYNKLKVAAKAENKTSSKRVRVGDGALERLVTQAKTKFDLPNDFSVPMSTVKSRIDTGKLEVWHPGESSLLLHVETVLKSYLMSAAELNCPLNVNDTIAFMNHLLEGSKIAAKLIRRRRNREGYDPDTPLVGRGWYKLFLGRNPDIVTTTGANLEQNRFDHMNFASFTRMFDLIEKALLSSGNARKLDPPVHMDAAGKPVEDESSAVGYPVNIDIHDRGNVFCMDETGDNTHGKKDGRRGGERFVVGRGQGARNVVGTNDCHFTVVPTSNLDGRLVMLTVIFPGKKLKDSWCIGIDVFADFNDNEEFYAENFGPGKRYPGLELLDEDGNKIPICFGASESACMTGEILTKMFEMMDKLGISKRGTDKDGNPIVPCMIIDGHPSRMNPDLLTYLNEELTRWKVVVGCPYGTGKWQLHDDKAQNGNFKTMLRLAKKKMYEKKRLAGLPIMIRNDEIVIVVREAVALSFMNVKNTLSALSRRGIYPFNRNPLMDPQILATAPEEVRQERTEVLRKRGVTHDESTFTVVTIFCCVANVLLFTLSLVNCRVKNFSFADRNESIGCRVWTSSRRS
jgi:hypothetical protein